MNTLQELKKMDKLRSSFARAALNLIVPHNLSNKNNVKRWNLYVESVSLVQAIDCFSDGLSKLNCRLNNAPLVFDIKEKCQGGKAELYSLLLGNAALADEICLRLGVSIKGKGIKPAEKIKQACAALIEFDDDEDTRRAEWVELYAKACLMSQNEPLNALQDKLKDDRKLFKRMARFIEM